VDCEALRHPVLPVGRSELLQILARIFRRLDLQTSCLELRITSDQAISQLHARHLGGAGPTNVLAFPADAPDRAFANTLGSIALNVDAVIREAWLYGQEPNEHFIRLLTHALLHLTGLEHGPIMDELTETVLDDFRNDVMETR
jgi:probable rRNA maturation factor